MFPILWSVVAVVVNVIFDPRIVSFTLSRLNPNSIRVNLYQSSKVFGSHEILLKILIYGCPTKNSPDKRKVDSAVYFEIVNYITLPNSGKSIDFDWLFLQIHVTRERVIFKYTF